MIQDVYIIGATGKVGKTLVEQIITKGDTDDSIHKNPTRIVGLASSRKFLFSPEGLSNRQSLEFISRQEDAWSYSRLGELVEIAEKECNGRNDVVFIDATNAGEPMTQLHLHIINNTPFSIVTANKNPITLSDYATFQNLTRTPQRYGYRCSVMAGAEAITFLQDVTDLNDALRLIQGCFSGTLGYLSSGLGDKRKFSEILSDACGMGYTEPDPRDDLSGLDVARKLVALARTAGYPVEMKDVKVDPFIPKDYFVAGESKEMFLERAEELDTYFGEKTAHAEERGRCLRYVAEMKIAEGAAQLETSLQEVPKESPLGILRGTLNKFVVITGSYPENSPYSVTAPGAGLEVTARNIRRDLLYHLKGRETALRL